MYGKFETTNSCLESIYQHQGERPFEIVLVNNRNDRATLANMVLWAEARSNVTVEAGWTNFNFALACNVGFAAEPRVDDRLPQQRYAGDAGLAGAAGR